MLSVAGGTTERLCVCVLLFKVVDWETAWKNHDAMLAKVTNQHTELAG